MHMIEQKSHGHYLFSFNEVDESLKGKNKLSEFLNSLMRISEAVVCLCERPLFNKGVETLVKDSGFGLLQIQSLKFDDFELSFTYEKSGKDDGVINFLSDCFYFFEHPAFIFLVDKADIVACKEFCGIEKDWKYITDNINSCFVFKSVEDDVVWYKLSPDVHVE
ncbi:hypothetical protein [Microbulbifer sp. TRSA005]|uniref:hypothetical protein n=1 Tax=Microbulbifer sp. TRSA005 TaxID=3243383 RepID=UPI00403A74DD